MRILALAALLVLPAGVAGAANIEGFSPDRSPEENGRAIAEEADRRGEGYGDTSAALSMTLFDGRGNSVTRAMRSRTLERTDDGDRTLLFFEDPADVRGTAFLTHGHPDRDDDQWLYLPAVKRVKRIASRNRSGAFMSSEFSYEDLGNDDIEKYRYRYLGDETIDGQDAYKLERLPVGTSGYSRQVAWLDQQHLRILKIDYYDRAGALLKTLSAQRHELYEDRFWRALRMEMNNHQTGRRTVLEWADYVFGSGLDARDFEREALRDLR
ncbi:MAG: outer membrane lipoprotein-sorting protein [Pseudomonadota bacterium]